MSIKVNNLLLERNEQILVNNLSFSVQAGQILLITGANGCGKTTLLRSLAGLTAVQEGEVVYGRSNINHEIAEFHRQLIYIGHQAACKLSLSVCENIRMDELLNTRSLVQTQAYVLRQLGLESVKDSLAQDLSAGQLRRLALAPLLIKPATLWILDEPFVALDSKGCEFLQQAIAQHTQNSGITILTSHSHEVLQGLDYQCLSLDKAKESSV